jgi:OFA family oxalate/formate antiporter-like MFS transporter
VNRWIRLGAAVTAMTMIANLQYGWTLFVKPIMAGKPWKLSDVQWAFTIFIALETWAMPCSGWLIDRIGPRLFLTAAGVMCGIGWSGLGQAQTLTALYLLYALAGFGAALVYCGSMGVALKWFPDKRGLAAGLISAGFGSGASLFIPLMAYVIRVQDYKAAFIYTGIFQGLLIVIAGQLLKNPTPSDSIPAPARMSARGGRENFTSMEMLQTPHFYMMFLMAVMMGIGGLMATAQVGPMAGTLNIGAAVLTLSLTLNPLANGASRLFWGWASDHIGRERAMIIAFFLQAIFLLSVVTVGKSSSTMFILTLVLVYFTWGEVYSLFPSLSADLFGSKNASSNYSFLYSAKGVASIVGGGLAATLFEKTGSWDYGFYGCAVLALCSAVMAIVLKSMPLPSRKTQTVPPAAAAADAVNG